MESSNAQPGPAEPRGSAPGEHLPPGTRLGRYTVERRLGRGAFASVYRVRHAELGRSFALKVLHEQARREKPQLTDLLLEEARTLGELRHPNIVSVIDLVSEEPRAFYVMELVRGTSLARLLGRRGRLDVQRALRLGRDAASALEAAAEHGIVHRDIKPGNLLVTLGQRVKLIDFGLARRLEELAEGQSIRSTAGTPVYMAPEQVGRGRVVDARADMYALGATLYHATCGRPPFEGRSARELARRKSEEFVPRPRSLVAGYPVELEEFVLELLAARPEHRPAAWGEVVARLEALLEGRSSASDDARRAA